MNKLTDYKRQLQLRILSQLGYNEHYNYIVILSIWSWIQN